MAPRPAYVAVIGWLLIAIGALSILLVGAVSAVPGLGPKMAPGPEESDSILALNLLASALELACGLFILRGANWARWLYAALSVLSGAYLLIQPSSALAVLVIYLVIVLLTLVGLFTPAASRFFQRSSHEEQAIT